ncbi:MAG: M23 family metallopeptidase [Spirochaetaceae bacterium]|jgi:LysM repeat protein|nr:M23 family metallopeptidase [Spirochaetaceae bacterium]
MLNVKKLRLLSVDMAARLIIVFAIFFYAPAALTPVCAAVMTAGAGLFPRGADGGIGGMSYTENELEKINVEAEAAEAEVAIPEPEEYSAPIPVLYSSYRIQRGDMIGLLAETFGLNQGTLVSVNSIKNSRAIYPDEMLKVPNQDGIIHTVAAGETLQKIAANYSINEGAIVTANELFSEKINTGSKLFLPGAKLDYTQLQEINGDLFIWPIRGRITSRYGYRINPVSGRRAFHTGVDLSGVTGVPIKAAMSGRVTTAGYNDIFGNYVVIAHHSNYRTLYGHMSSIRAKRGAYVRTGEIIGYVGNTGQSTGSHLHFTVYKNGVTVNPLLLMR